MKKISFWIMICLLILCSGLIGYGLKECDCDVLIDGINNTEEVKTNLSLALAYVGANFENTVGSYIKLLLYC